jgi:hypothetical protein
MITPANQEFFAAMTPEAMTRHEAFAEWIVVMLDGCDDDDEIKPALVRDAIRDAGGEMPSDWGAGLLRQATRGVREELAVALTRRET